MGTSNSVQKMVLLHKRRKGPVVKPKWETFKSALKEKSWVPESSLNPVWEPSK